MCVCVCVCVGGVVLVNLNHLIFGVNTAISAGCTSNQNLLACGGTVSIY